MSVDPRQKHFGLKRCALLLSCLLSQQSLLARSGEGPIFFQAASITGTNALVTAPSTGARSVDATSVTASAHKADAANIRALIASHEEAGDFYSPAIAELAEALGNVLQAEG